MVKGYVLVTGGSRGIGRAIVLKFSSEGYYVIFTYLSRLDAANETLRMLRSVGGDGFYIRMDVSDELSVRKCYEVVSSKIPYLNVLVNNAGILSMKGIDELDLDEWERVLRVNLTGTFLVTKYFLSLLRKAPWASIVNIASLAGQTGHSITSVA